MSIVLETAQYEGNQNKPTQNNQLRKEEINFIMTH